MFSACDSFDHFRFHGGEIEHGAMYKSLCLCISLGSLTPSLKLVCVHCHMQYVTLSKQTYLRQVFYFGQVPMIGKVAHAVTLQRWAAYIFEANFLLRQSANDWKSCICSNIVEMGFSTYLRQVFYFGQVPMIEKVAHAVTLQRWALVHI